MSTRVNAWQEDRIEWRTPAARRMKDLASGRTHCHRELWTRRDNQENDDEQGEIWVYRIEGLQMVWVVKVISGCSGVVNVSSGEGAAVVEWRMFAGQWDQHKRKREETHNRKRGRAVDENEERKWSLWWCPRVVTMRVMDEGWGGETKFGPPT